MFDSINSSLVWFIFGVALMLAELVLPGFVIFFFGIGAVLTAGISYFAGIENLAVQMAIFLGSSLITLLLFRKRFSSSFKGDVSHVMKPGDTLENIKGKKAVVIKDILADGVHGKVEFNGTVWEADSDEPISKDEVVEIIERIDLKLKVKKP